MGAWVLVPIVGGVAASALLCSLLLRRRPAAPKRCRQQVAIVRGRGSLSTTASTSSSADTISILSYNILVST